MLICRISACFGLIWLWSASILGLANEAGLKEQDATGSATYSGQATAITIGLLGTPTRIAHTGALPSQGGALESSLLEIALPISTLGTIGAETLHSTTIGQGNNTESESSILGLNLSLTTVSVSASLLRSNASAICGSTPTGESEIVGLMVNGNPINITGQPNQTINLLLGKIIINEQIVSSDSIKVNALHVSIPGIVDIIISSAEAGITCKGAPPCKGNDFVTGGGYIEIDDKKGNFGVAGGIKNNAKWGHLTFIDHKNNIKVHGTGVTAYTIVNPTTRRITGNCKVNNQTGYTYIVTVADNGEPGVNDSFRLQLSDGYDTANKKLGGGNIQLHKPCK